MLLPLFLLLLAFFIVLNAISSIEKMKSNVVRSSLTSTFSTLLEPRIQEAFTSRTGAVVEAQEFHTEVTNLFATAIPAAKVEVLEPGALLRVTYHADELFFPGGTRFRPGRMDLLDRLVAALSAKPPEAHREMEFLIGVESEENGALPVEPGLPLERAGAFGRLARERGMPPDSLVIGLEAGPPSEVQMLFRRRPREETDALPPSVAGEE